MDVAVVFADLATDALAAITDTITLAVPVLVALVSITIVIGVFRKFGVKR